MPVTPKRCTTEAKVSAPKRRGVADPLPEATVAPVESLSSPAVSDALIVEPAAPVPLAPGASPTPTSSSSSAASAPAPASSSSSAASAPAPVSSSSSAASAPVPCAKDVALLMLKEQKAAADLARQKAQQRQEEEKRRREERDARLGRYLDARRSNIENQLRDPKGWTISYAKMIFKCQDTLPGEEDGVICRILAQRYPSFKFTSDGFGFWASIPEAARIDAVYMLAAESPK